MGYPVSFSLRYSLKACFTLIRIAFGVEFYAILFFKIDRHSPSRKPPYIKDWFGSHLTSNCKECAVRFQDIFIIFRRESLQAEDVSRIIAILSGLLSGITYLYVKKILVAVLGNCSISTIFCSVV